MRLFVSDACQIKDLDHNKVAEAIYLRVSDACQIKDLPHGGCVGAVGDVGFRGDKEESFLSRLSLGAVLLVSGGYCSVCDLLSSLSFYITSFTYIGLVMGAVTGGILGLIFLPVALAEVVLMVGIAFCLGPIAQTLLSSVFFDGGLGRQIVLLLMKTGSALLSILLCCTIVDMYPKCYGFVFGGTTISQSIILLWLRYTMPALILYAPSL